MLSIIRNDPFSDLRYSLCRRTGYGKLRNELRETISGPNISIRIFLKSIVIMEVEKESQNVG